MTVLIFVPVAKSDIDESNHDNDDDVLLQELVNDSLCFSFGTCESDDLIFAFSIYFLPLLFCLLLVAIMMT